MDPEIRLDRLSPGDYARVTRRSARLDADLKRQRGEPVPQRTQRILDTSDDELMSRHRKWLLREAKGKDTMSTNALKGVRHDLPEDISTHMFMEVMDALYKNGYVVVLRSAVE
jgi:hypothetical protein